MRSSFVLCRIASSVCLILGFATIPIGARAEGTWGRPLRCPETRTVDQVDDFHATKVPDPYRWLEDASTEETRDWVAAQNAWSSSYIRRIPERRWIKERLTELWNCERYSLPQRRGNRYFYTKNDGLQDQSVLYTAHSLEVAPRVLLDPNLMSEDGTVALDGYAVSEDGRHLAYALATSGSDWTEWYVRDVETGSDLGDRIRWVKFSNASWTADGRGFFYSRYDEPEADTRLSNLNYYQKLYYHRLGEPQSDDSLVYERPDEKEWGFDGRVTDDGRYLIIDVWRGSDRHNGIFYKELGRGNSPVVELLNRFDASYAFIDNDGPILWFKTDLDSPRHRVIAVDTRDPAPDRWAEIVPQREEVLRSVSAVGNRLLAVYLRDAHSMVARYRLDGTPDGEVQLPGLGSVHGFGGRRGDDETFYSFTSFTVPTTLYRYDVGTGCTTLLHRSGPDVDTDAFETEQIFYHSKDGTRVPMFITHRRGIRLDGSHPTYLYGYGGFGAAMTPYFSVTNMVWLEIGGVVAVPNLRGGGEYGEEWHDAGRRLRKQNTFDDFIAAAEWLIDHRYTSREKLAIGGGSNGGLLVGACMTQRPDLFAAAVPANGVLDMLRFHRFTIGWAWVSDYGSPDDPEEFQVLYRYSPVHNVKAGTHYPATFVTTADHDDRVVPAHSYKFTAALQAAQAGRAPILIRVDTKAGHGGGMPTGKLIEERADIWAFLVRALGIEIPAAIG